jgi:hypothetical protein
MFKTPWDNPSEFEALTLRDILDYGLEGIIWDGNIAFTNKMIDPFPHTRTETHVNCLYTGVKMVRYSLDRIVFIEKHS